MKRRQQKQIFQTINNLTNNEDYRQQLWVHHLSGDSSTVLKERLIKIQQKDELYDRLQEAVWTMYKNPPSHEFLTFLKSFSEFEQSIMFLLLMDLSVNEVSEYKGISLVRMRQIITAIRNNPVWEERWQEKEVTQYQKKKIAKHVE